jgi:small subunit ribosomal protein S21|tara:strand:+ start:1133 stop:1324 length:192 start_codon:yes stop_codon:yes gene_type:complete
MIIIPVLKNNIDKAVKAFRYKLKKTQVLKKLRENRYYIKKNEKRRNGLEKAISREKWNLENED